MHLADAVTHELAPHVVVEVDAEGGLDVATDVGQALLVGRLATDCRGCVGESVLLQGLVEIPAQASVEPPIA